MPSIQNIPPIIDLTLLDPLATSADIKKLASKGVQYAVAAICVLPQHLDFINAKHPIDRATVVNFPTGNEPHHQVLQAIEKIATQHQIDEIDYVFPWKSWLDGDKNYAISCCTEACKLTQKYGLRFKVIIETGALPSPEIIYQLSLDVINNSGCDFIKSSTGKIAVGATIVAEQAMLSAIINSKKTCGIKLSGGVRTTEQALTYMQLAEDAMGINVDKNWFRLGTSALLDEIPNHVLI